MRLNNLLLSSLLAAWPCYASPMPVLDLSLVNSPETELLVREGINLARSLDVQKRASADFSLEKSWNNQVLFGGAWNSSDAGLSENAELSVTCLECYTHGTVTAKVTDKDIIHPVLRLTFSGVEAYASLGVAASAGQTFSITLFSSDTPIGIGITGLDVGVVFFVDLVFSLDAAIDLSAGFSVSIPDDAFLEANIFKGDVDDSSFSGLNSQYLPVTVISGHATFKADLRLRVQAGAEASIDLFGIGAGAVVGIYANLIEFVATIEKTDTCELEAEVSWDLNVGAFAHLDVVVDYTTLGPVPTVSTTLMVGAAFSTCLLDGAAASTTAALPATTSDAATSAVATSAAVTSEAAASTPVFSLPSGASLIGETVIAGVTTPAAATTASASGTDLVWAPSFVLSVTVPEVSFTVADPLPIDTATSLPASAISSVAISSGSASSGALTTATASSALSSGVSSAAVTTAAGSSALSSDASTPLLTTATSAVPSGYSSAAVSSVSAASSAAYTSVVGAGTYPVLTPSGVFSSAASTSVVGAGSYPVLTPSAISSSAAAGPTYTSTYTYSMTRCGAPGVMNVSDYRAHPHTNQKWS
ncbi:hypothetical protein ONZ43_g7521 [Nemania bipapillata]|uniref:Uncharacterized protein n=1 Tax=Nemania bipapillata TaxID=110536 RepID=A0ACC2HQ72_9PEZI|nr:hypothetical protein ONZ43_g7521 [Nemania bipapillata]